MRLVRARVAPNHPAGGSARLSLAAHTHITNSYLNSFTIETMGIGHYIKDIGRGKDGARALDRARATDLMGQILDQQVSDLELGAFCIAMRIKGETPEEMAGFLDATHARLNKVHTGQVPTVVLPSYNGARKLPVLTPLLALLLAREGVAVVVHGAATEDKRVSSQTVFAHLGVTPVDHVGPAAAGQVQFIPTGILNAGLDRLLAVRRVVGLRNPGHSLVKLMNPCDGPALVVSSYTHPEYLLSMSATFALTGQHALLLRGTEGEPVADARRTPAMDVFKNGQTVRVQDQREGSLVQVPELPTTDAAATATYTEHVLQGLLPVPEAIARQVQHILHEVSP
jgi:anthranilate phosphoribosyltransferase